MEAIDVFRLESTSIDRKVFDCKSQNNCSGFSKHGSNFLKCSKASWDSWLLVLVQCLGQWHCSTLCHLLMVTRELLQLQPSHQSKNWNRCCQICQKSKRFPKTTTFFPIRRLPALLGQNYVTGLLLIAK